MNVERNIFRPSFDFESAIEKTRTEGYFFAEDVLDDELRLALEKEIDSLPLESGDHVSRPINADKPNEVRQQHERLYLPVGDGLIPAANFAICALSSCVKDRAVQDYLRDWRLNEVGYQRYRHSKDFIGPHRDRSSDRFLSVTITINGTAPVRIFEPKGDYWDYSNLLQTDEFNTSPGSLMLLRAPGLGSGEQVVHQVLPPIESRAILNLRDRPSILENPSNPKWHK